MKVDTKKMFLRLSLHILPALALFLLPGSASGKYWDGGAMLIAEGALNGKELGPPAGQKEEKVLDLQESQDGQGWERRFFGEPLLQEDSSQKKALRWKSGPNLSLKSPGTLPGLELGFEMHSFQALQSVVPPENLPKGMDLKQERPLLLPPSVIGPDYNGGFLRFTW